MSDWYSAEMDWKWNLGNIWGKITTPFTNFFWWIIKSIQYSWFLRKDFDWDYVFILLLLQYKLKRTRKRIIKNNILLHSEQVASEIKHAEDLIQNWRDNEWCEDLQKAHDKKWGEQISFKNSDTNKKLTWLLGRTRENATTQELRAQEIKEQRAISNAMGDAEQKCWNEIFNQIKKYGQNWWD